MYINKFTLNDFKQYVDSQNLNTGLALSHVEKAGEGNMNYTFRLIFENASTLIIKQAPPYCAKFPDIAAPQQRIAVESQFYRLIENNKHINKLFPNHVHFDPTNYIMCLEDLGKASDFTTLYASSELSLDNAQQVVSALSAINSIEPSRPIENKGMKALNHAHIFDIPLQQNNGVDLNAITQGLAPIAAKFINDVDYKKTATELGHQYLHTGTHLLHGDYYPGSWLKSHSGVAIIDPEFCFTGCIEFDLGNLLAHLVMSEQQQYMFEYVLANYKPELDYSLELALMFAGTEIMRRLIGYGQLPLSASLATKSQWLDKSYELVRRPQLSVLYAT